VSPYRKNARGAPRKYTLRDRFRRVRTLAEEAYTRYRERECVTKGHSWYVSKRWVFGFEMYVTGVDHFGYDAECGKCGRKIRMFDLMEAEIRNLVRGAPDPKLSNPRALEEWLKIPAKVRSETIRKGVLASGGYLHGPRDSWTYLRNPKGFKGFPQVAEYWIYGEVVHNVRGMVIYSNLNIVSSPDKRLDG